MAATIYLKKYLSVFVHIWSEYSCWYFLLFSQGIFFKLEYLGRNHGNIIFLVSMATVPHFKKSPVMITQFVDITHP